MPATWDHETDVIVRNHVERFGLRLWNELSKALGGKHTPRQVRERWVYHLDPSINHGPWTPEEDDRIVDLFTKSCGSWSVMALNLPGRTDMQVKNHWAGFYKKKQQAQLTSSLESSSQCTDAGELADMFESAGAEMPPSPPQSNKRKISDIAGKPMTIARKVSFAPTQCSDSAMIKTVFGGFSPSPFANINAMLSTQPDARKQKWDGLGIP